MATPECVSDPDKWFSEAEEAVTEAKLACERCPVQRQCADLGEDEEAGIWGGMTPEDRRVAKRFRFLVAEEVMNRRIREMQADGASISAIARELDVPRKTLADRVRRLTGLAA